MRRKAGRRPGSEEWGRSLTVCPRRSSTRSIAPCGTCAISITDRCNFRCRYCMPEEGMKWLPRQELLTFEELERVARVCVERYGFESIRITGGEPTVRAHLPVLIKKLAALGVDLSMTTNGATLALIAGDLKRRRIAAHQHVAATASGRSFRGHHRTRRPAPGAGRDRRGAPGRPRPGQGQLRPGAGGQRRRDRRTSPRSVATTGVEVRFIEWMPLDAGGEWAADRVVPASEVIAAIDAGLSPRRPSREGRRRPSASPTATARGAVGVIASVTRSFCCDPATGSA